jgi:D-alanyl-D-alanine carboxypeptidase/D-alanyl-D-alanine carboxypeptidase (penicillin-binding protein 5/6)
VRSKKLHSLCLPLAAVLLLLLSSAALAGAAGSADGTAQAPGALSAKSAVLMAADTGEVLFEKDARTPRPMASTTKLMTALIACEANTPDRTIRVTDELSKTEGTCMGLKEGETVTLQALVTGAMLASGNDAANAIAVMLSGSPGTFANKMNVRARQLGMDDTHFVTPSGLDADGHEATAYDMALLGRAAAENQALASICATKSAKVSAGERTIYLSNHNRLLREYPGCAGLKTGYTKKAGRCLVTAARRKGVTLVCVTLSAPNDWADHKKLLDYGFAQMENRAGKSEDYTLAVVGGDSETVTLECPQTPILPNNVTAECVPLLRPFEYAPIAKGRIAGEVRYYSNGELICSLPLITTREVRGKRT